VKNANRFKRLRVPYVLGGLTFVLLFLVATIFFAKVFLLSKPVDFGVTFSAPHARYLKLNAWETYLSLLDDLHVRFIRLPVYWNETETSRGTYDWKETDYFMEQAAKRGVKVTLVIGAKVPRWPECHLPEFIQMEVGTPAYGDDLVGFLKTTVERYKDSPALLRYQVENEPLFPFGLCPPPDLNLLKREISVVRQTDPTHDIQLTVSGESESWLDLAKSADVIGVSLYRVVWNKNIGPVVYPHSTAWYAVERQTIALWVKRTVISELQGEPWFDGGNMPEDLGKAYAAFPAERLRDHVAFAKRTGFSEVYLWGAEWWYYLKAHGNSRLFDEARTIFR
jgi:hypothetical protein